MRIRKPTDFRYLLCTFLLLLPVMIILSFFSADTYSIIRNTTSHLGAQGAPNAWIMNMTFILVGISCILEAWLHLRRYWFLLLLLCIFGLNLVLVGIFSHAPIVEGAVYDALEDRLHSIFASIAGFSFTAFAISSAFIEKTTRHRAADMSVGLTAALLSLLMACLPDYAGLWQRVLFTVSFIWLILLLERTRAAA
ncbi:MAG TPA: DUF998 domain-containing protein [Candidatus Atribacteria bacterium]|nr:DUF998 domain-containing protein [Candidatus Atribacteria bacterium]